MVQLSQIKIYPSSRPIYTLLTPIPIPIVSLPMPSTAVYRASILLKLSPQLGGRTGSCTVSKVEDCINISSCSPIHHSIRPFHPPSTVYPHAMGTPLPQRNISRPEEK